MDRKDSRERRRSEEGLEERKQFIEQDSGNSKNGWDSEHWDGKGYTFSIVTEGEEKNGFLNR